jgi:hypothetical protein
MKEEALSALQRHHHHAHGRKQQLAHLAGLFIHGLWRQGTGKPAAEAVGGHVFSITEIPELAVVEMMDGQQMGA